MPIQVRLIKEAFRKRLMAFPAERAGEEIVDAGTSVWETILAAERERISWEGESFNPPASGLWVKEAFLLADEGLYATDLMEASGIYQLDIYSPQGEGVRAQEDLADALKWYFKPASSFVDGETGIAVAIDKSQRSKVSVDRSTVSVGQNFPWLNVSVEINWRSYAPE
jgi:hypothetical protein